MPRSTPRDALRRSTLAAAAGILVVAASLAAFLVRQVASECDAFVLQARARLEQLVGATREALLLEEERAAGAVGRAALEEVEALRRVPSSHPVALQAFVISGGAVVWPRALEREAPYSRSLWAEGADSPGAREALAMARELDGKGDAGRAASILERALVPSLPPPARAELELARAGILARDPARRKEAAAGFDRILAPGGPRDGGERQALDPAGELAPWQLAAALRQGTLLLETGEADRGADVLLELLAAVSADEAFFSAGRFTRFFAGRAIEALAAAPALTPGRRERLDALRARRVQLEAEAAFREELDLVWLPSIRAAGLESGRAAGDMERLSVERAGGQRAVAFLREPGDPEAIAGFLVDLGHVEGRLQDALQARGAEGEDPPRLGRGAAAPGGSDTLRVEVAPHLPWTVELPLGEALRRFRGRRVLLYGAVFLGALLAAGAAAVGALRGMARQAELAELKSRFVANVSHELKTPLTLIRMFTDLLILGYRRDAAGREEDLRVIAREAETLGLLIDDILDVSRIEAGEKQYHFAPEDPAGLLEEAVGDYRPFLERKGFQVRLALAAGLPAMALDRTAVSQAVRNLLSNAAKYSGEAREVEVSASLRNGALAVEVADRGMGIRPGDERRVFDRFYRSPGSPGAGAGIGLAIVKHAVEAHGGSVAAARREGGGSVFTLLFPTAPGGGP